MLGVDMDSKRRFAEETLPHIVKLVLEMERISGGNRVPAGVVQKELLNEATSSDTIKGISDCLET